MTRLIQHFTGGLEQRYLDDKHQDWPQLDSINLARLVSGWREYINFERHNPDHLTSGLRYVELRLLHWRGKDTDLANAYGEIDRLLNDAKAAALLSPW